VRIATLPGVTEEMLARLMNADMRKLRRRGSVLANAMRRGEEVRITCGNGSDLLIELGDRTPIADAGDLHAPGAFGNLPCGEAFIAPTTAEGTLVVDGSIAGVGKVETPVELTVRDGHLVDATGPEGEQLLELLTKHGEDGTNIAELGIGTNEEATLTGNILEDEKILGTAHVAFGASAAIGGNVQVPVHLDCVIVEPTVEIDGNEVARGGELLV
jgi:leucyl aminopeptidase (aminopeptidase T)